jgi:single-strand DNA-binding protein
MLNKVTLIGFLGADPEVRSLNDGARVTNLRVATSESWKDRSSGERRERTEWHRVTLWGDGIANYLETRKWTDNEGHDRYSTEIVVNQKGGGQVKILRDGVDAQEQEPEPQPQTRTRGRKKAQQREDFSANLDDEVPF